MVKILYNKRNNTKNDVTNAISNLSVVFNTALASLLSIYVLIKGKAINYSLCSECIGISPVSLTQRHHNSDATPPQLLRNTTTVLTRHQHRS